MTSLHSLFLSTLSITVLLLHFILYNASGLSPPTIPTSPISSPAIPDTSSYIIHTDNSSRPSNFISQSEWYASLIQTLLPSKTSDTTGSKTHILYTYQMALHGFSSILTHEQAEKISNSPGVIGVYKDKLVKLQTTHTPNFLGLNPDFGLWPDSNFGDDVIIGLIDSGIWPESLSFDDSHLKPVSNSWRGQCESGTRFNSTMCNNKLVGARFFKAGMEAMMFANTNDYDSPRDSAGHGTHTASTAAGSPVANANFYGYALGMARGIAPNAKIAMYKVCWGGCALSDVLAGIEKAIEDGVHILSISLGGGSEFPYDHDPIAIGTLSAWRHGIFVACAAGNSGPVLSSVSNSVPWVMTVAASSIDRSFSASVILGSGEVVFGESLYFEKVNKTDMFPMIDLGYCFRFRLVPNLVMGKIVVCQYASVETGFYIEAAGGVGLISVNRDSSSGETIIVQSFTLPALSIGYSEGKKIDSYFESTKNPVAKLEFEDRTIIGKTRAPKVASFSSRGPNPQMPKLLKPDIIAPGSNILAAWPSEAPLMEDSIDPRRSDFNIISGTSMACPHVAGTAALIKHVHPDWSPSMVQSAIMTTAFTLDNRYRPIIHSNTSQDATPLAIGSGHIFPQAASNPGLVYESGFEDHVNWLCTMNYTSDQMKKFVPWPVNCSRVMNDKTWDLNYPSFAVLFNNQTGDNVVRMRTLTKMSKFPESYTVRVENMRPDKVEVTVSPNRLDFGEINEKRTYKVEFKCKISVNTSETEYTHAYIIWENEEHQVKSPVVFMWNYVNPFH
ncbi:hypothetical protein LUZ60_005207 [Juncus effusus]|nr:hypothetical protein LUZ60_005207 [Juncus effusus]